MKKYVFRMLLMTVALLSLSQCLIAQQYNQRLTNNKTNEEILIGLCTRNAFLEKPFENWFTQEYNLYRNIMDKSICDSLKPLMKNIRITIVLGTWCSDSRQQVPDFFTIADYLNMPDSVITIICVDRDKQAVAFSIEDKKIELVPTFIIYRQGAEIGRIIETPSKSLEKDLLAILKTK
ncbi:MAG TPA: thioredoxin family protein [Bacteroidia bacterium]|nr:thioredoxin family protein [Bacteroidia bacterium]HRU67182.1 thioredoxin family protein [Bacteroidia bacterium]